MSDGPRILLSTGDGKGKTTAALGLALRAAGHDMRVCIIQFVKNDSNTGELAAIEKLPGVEIAQTGLGFIPHPEDEMFPDHKTAANKALAKASEVIEASQYDVVILDEVCLAVARDLLEEEAVCDVVQKAHPESCIVLTGRHAPQSLIDLADTVTEMTCVKHGLQIGIQAQKGVEY